MNRRTSTITAAVLVMSAGLVAAAVVPGCSLAEYDSVDPVEVPGPELDGGASGAGGAAAVTPRVRTVETRNPWGNVPGNLLLDGDFELSAGAGNANLPGWQAFRSGSSDGSVDFETGGLCRRGLHCAVAERGMALLGWGVAADGSAMTGSLWVQVPEGRGCEIVTAGILRWSRGNLSYLFAARQPHPDVQRWCHYEQRIPPQREATLLYVEIALQGDERALLDDARLVPADGTAPMSADLRQPTKAQQARAQAAHSWLRSRIRFGGPPWVPGAPRAGDVGAVPLPSHR